MNHMRPWSPGREYTAAISGETWYVEADDTLTVAAVLHGSWGTSRPEVVERFGPWDADAYHLWVGRIPKDGYVLLNDVFDLPDRIDDAPFYHWVRAAGELFDKPHRSLSTAAEHGEVLSRTPIAGIPGVRQIASHGLIRYESPADARAVRLWRQARVRAEIRRAAARRRWREYRDAETWHPGSYKGAARKYGPGRPGPR